MPKSPRARVRLFAVSLIFAFASPLLAATYDMVPEVRIPARGTNVEDYWATHPFNPAVSGGTVEINSPGRDADGNTVNPVIPGTVVNLPSGGDIVAAAAGGNKTIVLEANGTYAGGELIGVSNVHIICPDPVNRATVTGVLKLLVSDRIATIRPGQNPVPASPYAQFDNDLDGGVAEAWAEYRNPQKNFYLKNIAFSNPTDLHCFTVYRVWDVLFDNCSFRTRYPTQAEKHHEASIVAGIGNTNVSFLNCQFLGDSENALYFDGGSCMTVMNCTIKLDSDGTAPSGYNSGPLFLCNDDFTEANTWAPFDKIDREEELNAKYMVVTANTYTGNSVRLVSFVGEGLLFSGNTHTGTANNFVEWDSRSGSAKKISDPDWNYVFQNVVIKDNAFGSLTGGSASAPAAVLRVNHAGCINLAANDASAYMGGYRIAGNTITSAPSTAQYVYKTGTATYALPWWTGLELVGGNRWSGTGTLNSSYGLDAPVPSAPTNLVAQANGDTYIDLTWTDNSGDEVTFVVERMEGLAGDFVEVARTLINRTSFRDTGLTPGTAYYYRVRALNMLGSSDYATASKTTPPAGSPNAPGNLVVTSRSVNSLNLAWSDNSTNETGFKIERSLDGQTAWTQIAITAADVKTYRDPSLPRATTVYYRVRATNAVADSNYTATASAATYSSNPNLVGNPSFETTVSALNTEPSLWQSRNYLSRDTLFYRTGAASWKASSPIAGGYTFSYAYGPFEPNTQYTLSAYVRSSGAAGGGITLDAQMTGVSTTTTSVVNNASTWDLISKTFTTTSTPTSSALRLNVDLTAGSMWVDDVSLVKADTILTVPAVPSSPASAAVDGSKITVSWADGSSNEEGFRIERSLNGVDGWTTIGLAAANATSFTDNGLAAQTRYYYRVTAYNSGGYSAATATVNTTTQSSTDPGQKFQVLGARLVREQDGPVANASMFTGHHIQLFLKNTYSQNATLTDLAINGTGFAFLPNATANVGGVSNTRWWTMYPASCPPGEVAVVTMRLVNGNILGALGSSVNFGLTYSDANTQTVAAVPKIGSLWIPFVHISQDRKTLTAYVGNRGNSTLTLPANGGISVNGTPVAGTLPSVSLPAGATVPVTFTVATAFEEGKQLAIGAATADGQDSAWGAIRAIPTFFGHSMWYEVANYDPADRDNHFLDMSLNGRAVFKDEPFGSNMAPQTLADLIKASWASTPARTAMIQLTAIDETRIYSPAADVVMTHHQWDNRDLEFAKFLNWPRPNWYLPQNAWARKESQDPGVPENWGRLEDLQREAFEGFMYGAKNIQWFSMKNLWWQNATMAGGDDVARNHPGVYFPGTLGNPLFWDRVGRIGGWQTALAGYLSNSTPYARALSASNVEVATMITESASKAVVMLLDKATSTTGFYKSSVSTGNNLLTFSNMRVDAAVPAWLNADKAYLVDMNSGVTELPLTRDSATSVSFTLPQFATGAAVVLGTAADLAILQAAWTSRQAAFANYGDTTAANLAVPAEDVLLPDWNYSFPGDKYTRTLDVTSDGSRMLMARGNSVSCLGSDGAVLWQKTFAGEAMVAKFSKNQDRIYIAANVSAGENGNLLNITNSKIIACDLAGAQLWDHAVGETVFDIETNYPDNGLVYGTLGKLEKLSAAGALAWTRSTSYEALHIRSANDGTTVYHDRMYAAQCTAANATIRSLVREPATSPYESPQCVAISPDGSRVALGATNLYLYNGTGTPVGSPLYVGRGLRVLTFSGDGSRLAAGTSDGILKVYSKDGALLWQNIDKGSYVTDIVPTPDGTGFAVMREKFVYSVADMWNFRDIVDVFDGSGNRTARSQGPWRKQPFMGKLALAPAAQTLGILTGGGIRQIRLAASPASNASVFDGSLDSRLPYGWQQADVGTGTAPGSAEYHDFNNSFVLTGSGAKWETLPSQGHVAFREAIGNFTFTARAASFSGGGAYCGSGIFVSDGGNAADLVGALFLQPRQNINRAYYRTTAGASYSSFFGTSGVKNQWMRVARTGNSFAFSTSADGTTWTTMGTATMAMSDPVRVGLVVNPDADNGFATGTFDNVLLSVASAPAAPTNVSASMLSDTVVSLLWTDAAAGETGYLIEKSPSPNGPWSTVATTAANATSYNVTGLSASHTYYFRITALGASGTSAAVAASARTDAPRINLVANGSFETDANADAWADDWTARAFLTRASDRKRLGSWSLRSTGTGQTAGSTFTQALAASTYYRAIAYVQTSGAASGRGLQLQFAETRAGGTVSSGTREINESAADWRKLTLDFQTSSGFDGAGEIRLDTDLTGGGTLWADDVQVFRMTVPSLPDAPAAAALDASSIQVTWTDTSEMETGFEIDRSADGSSWTSAGTAARDATSFTDSGIPAAALRYYRVRAVNPVGNSPYSGTVSARTMYADQAVNGGMETDANSDSVPDGWAVPRMAWDAATAHSGSRSLRGNFGTLQRPETVVLPAPVSLEAGVAYQAQIWFKMSGVTSGSGLRLVFDELDASGVSRAITTAGNYTIDNSGTWALLTLDFTTRADHQKAALTAQIDLGAGSVWLDDFILRKKSVELPSAPNALTATATAYNSIRLDWADQSADESLFRIERALSGSGPWSEIGTVAANTTTYTDASLQPAVAYYFRVRSFNGAGASAFSDPASATTPDIAPSGVGAVAVTGGIRVSWTDNSPDETGFVIQRSIDNATWGQIGTASANATTYTDTSAATGIIYYYRVQAARAAGNTSWSASASAAMGSDYFTQSFLSGESTWDLNNKRITFSPVGNSYVGSCEVATSFATSTTGATALSLGDDSFVNVALTGGKTVPFFGTAYSSFYVGSNGFITFTSGDSTWAPTVWGHFNSKRIDALWKDLLGTTNGGAISYIQTADRVAVTFSTVKTFNTQASSSFQIELFFNGVIRITWLSADGFGAIVGLSNAGGQPSAYLSPGTDLSGYPAPIAGVPAQPGTPVLTPLTSSTMRVQWTDNSTIELGYRVERSPNGSSGWTTVGSMGENAVEYTDTGLAASTTYFYRVVGFNANGDGTASASASATTIALPLPPAAPSALVAVATSTTTVALGWTDNSSGETGFRIQRSTDNSTWADLLTPAANAASAEDTSASRNSTYFYRICAYNDGGNSAWSPSASATTPATGEFSSPAYAVWKLNETAGTTAADSSGNARNATAVDATWSQGDSGHDGLAFNGSTSRLNVGTLAGLPGPDFTISFWFKVGTFSNCLLFSKNDTVFPALSIGLYNWTGSEWNIQILGGSYGRTLRDTTTPSLTNLVAGQWVHITCVYNDAERRVYTYKDGVALPTTELYNPISWTSIAACFGQKSNDGTQAFNGKMDDIRIYSRALTATEVLEVRDSYAALVAGSPAITAQPSAATVIAGGSATFSVTAIGTPAPSYQWRKAGTDIPGATNATLTLTNIQPSDAATYSVYVSNTAGSVTSNGAVLTVQTAPVITSQPSSTTVAAGANATFTVTATGNPSPTYQWRKDGANISGATSSSLTISNAQVSSAGSYSVVVTNAAGSATSDGATLTIQPPPAAPGTPALTALSMSSIRIQWADNSSDETGFKVERSADGATGWTLVTTAAANATTHDDSGLSASTTYYYRVTATRSGADSSPSSAASCTTLAETTPPTVLSASASSSTQVLVTFSEPVEAASANTAANYAIVGATISAAVRQADTATVLLTVSGLSTGSYTVVVSGVRDLAGNTIAGSNQATFAYSTIPADGMTLWLRADAGVTQSGGKVSAWATQSTNSVPVTQATADSQPAYVASGVNGRPVLRFDGTNDHLAFTNLPVNGLTGITVFVVAANTANQDPTTHANASAIYWDETASWGTLYVSPYQTKVKYRFGTGQANNLPTYTRTNSIGSNFSITAAVHSGTTEALYVNGTQVHTGTGKTSAIANCKDSGFLGRGYNSTYYTGDIAEIVVYNRALTAQEIQTVQSYLNTKYFQQAPAITSQPASATVAPGGSATFTVTATGTPSPAYQWRKNGADVPGATSSSLTIANAQAADAGSYTVVVSNSVGSIVSDGAVLAVESPLPAAAGAPSAAPTSGSATNTVTLTWTDNSSNETGFRIETASSASGPWTSAGTVSANTTTASVTGLAARTTYYFRIVAYSASGDAAASAVVSARTQFPVGAPADANANGYSDFLEYALGSTDAAALAAKLPVPGVDGAADRLTLSFKRPSQAPADADYQLLASDDLVSWIRVTDPVTTVSGSGDTSTVTLKDSVARSSKTKRFLKLRIVHTP